jgi:hypothetical protein
LWVITSLRAHNLQEIYQQGEESIEKGKFVELKSLKMGKRGGNCKSRRDSGRGGGRVFQFEGD